MKYTYLFFLIFLICTCKRQQKQVQIPEEETYDDLPKGFILGEECKVKDLSFFYDCHQNDCYQVELISSYQDLVVLTLNLNGTKNDTIYYTRFHRHNRIIKPSKKFNVLYGVIPLTKDTIWSYSFKLPKKIITKSKNTKINYFFNTLIWDMEKEEKEQLELFHGETWRVKGRIKGKEITLNRRIYEDSTYYSNLQTLLDICKIKDYKYKKNK
jgi:hypothetical protein